MRLNMIKKTNSVIYLFTVILFAFVSICAFNRIEPILYFRPRLWVRRKSLIVRHVDCWRFFVLPIFPTFPHLCKNLAGDEDYFPSPQVKEYITCNYTV